MKMDMLKFDAFPPSTVVTVNEVIPKQNRNSLVNSVLNDLTVKEYKTIFFLLMDYIGEHEYFNITTKEKEDMKKTLNDIIKTKKIYCITNNKTDISDHILIELLATMKLYRKLRLLGTCIHIYEKQQHSAFNNINRVWKMFYAICEELTDKDLENLKQLDRVADIKDYIKSAEDWFYWALKKGIISKENTNELEKIFHNYPACLEIIKTFAKPESYNIRKTTKSIHCGIAVILNFENFIGKFEKRQGSSADVESLKVVWTDFGFKTEVHNDLSKEATMSTLKHYAKLDHSCYDTFVCCILSHGSTNCVISSDGEQMLIPDIIAEITDNCTSLISKPKLFFIQACQGTNINQGDGKPVFKMKVPDGCQVPEVPTTNLSAPPNATDVLLAVSSIPGFVSFRLSKSGSWFIEAFCKVMQQKGDKLSMLEVMIEVNRAVRENTADLGHGNPRCAQQIVNCLNTLNKNLFLKKRF